MRHAAGLLGVIGGLIGILVGLFGFGYVSLTEAHPQVGDAIGLFDNPELIRFASFIAPLLAIAGGAMAKYRALWAGVLMLMSCGAFYFAFGFNVATMFPIGFAGVGGVLALAAGKPDEEKAHF